MMVIFDMDDTLFREYDYVRSGREAVRRALYPDMTIDQLDKTLWGDAERQIYRTHRPDISLTDDARTALELLHAAGIPMAIVTDGRIVTQTNKYHALGLDKYIPSERLIISEAIGHDKRDPNAFDMLMRQGEPPFYYIGDNPAKDFYWPNQLGWTSVMLMWDDAQCVHPQSLSQIPAAFHPRQLTISLTDFTLSIL